MVLDGLDALTKLPRNEEEETRAEPRMGTASFEVEEKPRPCLNLAAPSPFRVSSS